MSLCNIAQASKTVKVVQVRVDLLIGRPNKILLETDSESCPKSLAPNNPHSELLRPDLLFKHLWQQHLRLLLLGFCVGLSHGGRHHHGKLLLSGKFLNLFWLLLRAIAINLDCVPSLKQHMTRHFCQKTFTQLSKKLCLLDRSDLLFHLCLELFFETREKFVDEVLLLLQNEVFRADRVVVKQLLPKHLHFQTPKLLILLERLSQWPPYYLFVVLNQLSQEFRVLQLPF